MPLTFCKNRPSAVSQFFKEMGGRRGKGVIGLVRVLQLSKGFG